MDDLDKTKKVWDKVWQTKDIPEWDYLSQIILEILLQEGGCIAEKRVLEAGSGSGRISSKLAALGAEVTLLDISSNALKLAQKMYAKNQLPGNFVMASIFEMPLIAGYFDIVWNAGVIEHYLAQEQVDILKEIGRVVNKKGTIITLNPYAKSTLHSIGKAIIERLVEYPFGREIPVISLEDWALKSNLNLTKAEYSVGFILLFIGAFKRLSLLPGGIIFGPILRVLNKLFCRLHESSFGRLVSSIDLRLSELFGGYLLVSVLIPSED